MRLCTTRKISSSSGLKSLVAAIVVMTFASFVIIFDSYALTQLKAAEVPYGGIVSAIVDKYWLPVLVASLALVTTLIEAITLARREEE